MRTIFCLIFCLSAGLANADTATGWLCKNNDFEITCDSDGCEASSEFTSMSLTVDVSHMSVCAYTGCWDGKPLIAQSETAYYAVSHDLLWIHDAELPPVTFQLALDLTNNVGVLNGEGFAHPVQCEKWNCLEDCGSE